METKICAQCKRELPLTEFRVYSQFTKKDGSKTYSKLCRECYAKKRKVGTIDNNITKDRRVKLFAFWLSLPGIAKDKDYFKRARKPLQEEESLITQLVDCKTIPQVAKLLDVDSVTLYNWKKSNAIKKLVRYFDHNNQALRFKNDVDYAFTRATIKHADAPRMKLWKQLYEGWEEKSSQTHTLDEANILSIQEKLKALAGAKTTAYTIVNEVKGLPKKAGGNDEELGAELRGLGERQADLSDTLQESARDSV
jgi:hypothetical protein